MREHDQEHREQESVSCGTHAPAPKDWQMVSPMEDYIEALGDEILDADEETFHLFSQSHSSRDLGMVDGKAVELDISIAGRDFTIKQSPGLLQSRREGGTTGAAVWECSVRFAEWLACEENRLFSGWAPLKAESSVLELGAGISGLVPLVLARRVDRVVATDQQYALNLLSENVRANSQRRRKGRPSALIDIFALDWETDNIASTFRSHGFTGSFDAVLACDCVFNYALIDPFVEACVETCKLGSLDENGQMLTEHEKSALCVVAQQLRQPDVFQQWLEAFAKIFRVCRVPDEMLTGGLKEGSGFVVHVGVLR